MNFSDASKVQSVLQSCEDVERIRGLNRAKILALANGNPPLDESSAAKMGLRVNFNDGSMAVHAQQGRRQYGNAFMSRGKYFKVRLPDAPEEHRVDWETEITNGINRPMKRSRPYFDLMRSQFASLLLHGMAPKVWHDSDCWLPKYIALCDFTVPTNTECSLEDLPWFSVREGYSEGKLAKKAFGPHADKGWNKPAVQKILAALHGQVNTTQPNEWMNAPEKMVSLMKQDGGWYSSDATPKIWLRHFYFYDDTDPMDCKWKLRVVVDQTNSSGFSSTTSEFLFDDGDTAVAADLSEILHCQFGDLNNDAPFKVYEVRSLGFLLMEACYWDNIITCRMVQHLMDNMNTWLRIENPTGEGRAQIAALMNKGILPPGVTVVPQTERHQVNGDLVDRVQGRMKTIKDEASVSYTQDMQGRQSPDETATAVMARVTAVNAMMSGLLMTAFNYEEFADREICRRFCKQGTTDKDCRKFQEQMRLRGIPKEWLDVERWEVEREIPIGAGNPTMEMVQANQLMQNRGAFSPQAQQEILHEYTVATTGNPRTAEAWAPVGKAPKTTSAVEFAQNAFAILMQGVPIQGRDELNAAEQANTLIGMLAGKVSSIEQTTNVTTPDQFAGLQTVSQFIAALIQRMSTDPQLIQLSKQFADKLGQLTNIIKGFGQRMNEAAQQHGQNGNGEAAAKAQAMMFTAQTKAQIDEQKAAHKLEMDKVKNAQKVHHNEADFVLKQQRENDAAVAETERQKLRVASEISTNVLKAAAEPKPEPAANGDK